MNVLLSFQAQHNKTWSKRKYKVLIRSFPKIFQKEDMELEIKDDLRPIFSGRPLYQSAERNTLQT